MNWLSTIVRVAAGQFPGASALSQLWSEIDADALEKRVEKLEDPISHLHEDVPAVSKIIYEELRSKNSARLNFDDQFYDEHSRSLAALHAEGHIKTLEALGHKFPIGIRVVDPSYIMYLCALGEDSKKMKELVDRVERCKRDESLDGKQLADETQLPVPVVEACFEIYEAKGFGMCSGAIGRPSYHGIA